MAAKPGSRPKNEFVFFDVVMRTARNAQPARAGELLDGLEKDSPRAVIIEQDRDIAENRDAPRWRSKASAPARRLREGQVSTWHLSAHPAKASPVSWPGLTLQSGPDLRNNNAELRQARRFSAIMTHLRRKVKNSPTSSGARVKPAHDKKVENPILDPASAGVPIQCVRRHSLNPCRPAG
jgi:hypothetical protein